ncbi:MAG: TSUP family transporter, partial [Limnobacter sp.]|nr:TSUP family transporter [Limnobacter sp.]
PATLLGTNKVSSVFGTLFAAFRYAKVAKISWNAVLPAAVMALPGALAGAYLVTQLPVQTLRLALPVMLFVIALYTYFKKDLGLVHAPRLSIRGERIAGGLLGFSIGFYDGLFGPGTGSFLMVGFVALFGFNFLTATAGAKVVNVICNLSSLVWFVPSGHVLLTVGVAMAVFNVLGAFVGSALAIARGSGFIRRVLLLLVAVLIVKTSYDVYWPLLVS